jgi:hypothetical protein
MKMRLKQLPCGPSYVEFADKFNDVSDAYAQLGRPPSDQDALKFASYATDATENYLKAQKVWSLAIRNNLLLAEKPRIRELLQAADTNVSNAVAAFEAMKERTN